MDRTDEIKKKIENVRDLIIMQDGEAVYDCNFRELDEALALLESAKAGPKMRTVCGSCGCEKLGTGGILVCGDCYAKLTKADPVRQDDGEFTEEARELARAYGSEQPDVEYSLGPPPLLKVSKKLKEACDRFDTQKQEIERLKAENEQLKGEKTHTRRMVERLSRGCPENNGANHGKK